MDGGLPVTLQTDFNEAVENTPFRQKVAIAVTRTVMNVMAGTPSAAQQALAKRFMLSPSSETDRYIYPTAARIFINGQTPGTATDTQIQTAVDQVLAVNVTLAVS